MPQDDIVSSSRKGDRYETKVVREEKPKPRTHGEKVDHDYSGVWDSEDDGAFFFISILVVAGFTVFLLVAILARASRGRIPRSGEPVKHTPSKW